MDETRIVIKNKARLVAQGHNQLKSIDYNETFALFARLEVIRIFLAFATYMNFIVYQMDVKSAFLNSKIKEEVYVKQPPGFENSEFPNHVCKLDKALYGLKQALRAWYESLLTYLTEHKFVRVKTPLVPPNKLGPDLNGKAVNETQYRGSDLKGYSDSDYAGCNMDKKSTSSACQLLGGKLMCWSAKKDHILKGDIELHFIPTEYQLVDNFTKPLDEPTFKRLIVELEESKVWVSTPTSGVGGDIGITTFRNALRARYPPHSSLYVPSPSIIIVRPWFATIGYNGEIGVKGTLKKSCLPPRWRLLMGLIIQCLDYAKIIWEDLINKLNKKSRENIVPYPRFISLLLEHMMSKYENEEVIINPTQAIYKLDVPVDSKAPTPSSQTKEVPKGKKPGAKSRLIRKQSSKHTFESKTEVSKSKTDQSNKDTQSSSAKDISPSHPSPPTPVGGEMHKEVHQVAGGPTSLGATRTNPSILVDQTKSVRDGLKTAHTDLDESEEEEESERYEDTKATSHTGDTSATHPLSPKSTQIQKLMAQVHILRSQQEMLEQQKAKAKEEVASLKIDFNKPLKEQDPLNELNELARKKRKRTSDLKDHSSITQAKVLQFKSLKFPLASALQVLRRLGSIFTSFYVAKLQYVVLLLEEFKFEGDNTPIVIQPPSYSARCKPRLIRWVLLLQGFNIKIKDKKGPENLAVGHLSRLENPNLEMLTEREIADEFLDEHVMVLKSKFNDDEPCETLKILGNCHSGPTSGHHGASVTAKKVYESGFY
ncbi:retrovirus-related pol polyprotein from transposon TNT 1-94 [Tanacetum coccineum]|uniref:Retrovirus-related pol polyprotein from transposon TNT 1-94 n=1 Tax=Tanacetum coccineum TaxID=301880 RepID=A0ABQ5F310_9ASTR